ncbi:MAG TPA: lytic transglycosylase domain-containing protein, partial [Blastococcus sp.]
ANQESGFDSQAVSPAGAQGLMQFMPSTAAGLGVNPLDPNSAIDGAARYLSSLKKQFGSTDLALAAYNAGPGTVSRYGGIPPYSETQNYVRSVMSKAEGYR